MSAYRRAVRWLGHQRWFAVLGRRFGARFDRLLYAATGGRLSSIGGESAPVLLLTTTGRRTGRERTTPVIYVRDGASFIVSSEDFGQSRPAGWPLNLDANPTAKVRVGSTTTACTAQRLDDREADEHWRQLVEAWPAHATYRRRSGKRHTFRLTPRRLDAR